MPFAQEQAYGAEPSMTRSSERVRLAPTSAPASDGRYCAGSGATGCFIHPKLPYRAIRAQSVVLRPGQRQESKGVSVLAGAEAVPLRTSAILGYPPCMHRAEAGASLRGQRSGVGAYECQQANLDRVGVRERTRRPAARASPAGRPACEQQRLRSARRSSLDGGRGPLVRLQ